MGFFFRSKPKEPEQKAPVNLENAIYVPLKHPASGHIAQPEVPNDKSCTEEEKSQRYQQVLDHFKTPNIEFDVRLQPSETDKKYPLTVVEKAWLTEECFMRYLRACNWKVDDAIKRLSDSIVWRREYGISNGIYGDMHPETAKYQIPELKANAITPDEVVEESLTGKSIIFGFDKGCRPCLYLYTERENTKPSERQVKFLVFMLECIINYMPQGQDKLALCVDFQSFPGVGLKGTNLPSVSVGKSVMYILQYHYPERLGRALFLNIPFVGSVFLKLCWPFLDPYTKQKVSFDNPFSDFIPAEQLPTLYEKGEANFQFDHDKYWKSLLETGIGKYRLYLQRFFELGGEVGLSEVELRSHEKVPEGEVVVENVDFKGEEIGEKLGEKSEVKEKVEAVNETTQDEESVACNA